MSEAEKTPSPITTGHIWFSLSQPNQISTPTSFSAKTNKNKPTRSQASNSLPCRRSTMPGKTFTLPPAGKWTKRGKFTSQIPGGPVDLTPSAKFRITQDVHQCAAGKLCKLPNKQITQFIRCAACGFAVHPGCGYKLAPTEHRKVKSPIFKRVCLGCYEMRDFHNVLATTRKGAIRGVSLHRNGVNGLQDIRWGHLDLVEPVAEASEDDSEEIREIVGKLWRIYHPNTPAPSRITHFGATASPEPSPPSSDDTSTPASRVIEVEQAEPETFDLLDDNTGTSSSDSDDDSISQMEASETENGEVDDADFFDDPDSSTTATVVTPTPPITVDPQATSSDSTSMEDNTQTSSPATLGTNDNASSSSDSPDANEPTPMQQESTHDDSSAASDRTARRTQPKSTPPLTESPTTPTPPTKDNTIHSKFFDVHLIDIKPDGKDDTMASMINRLLRRLKMWMELMQQLNSSFRLLTINPEADTQTILHDLSTFPLNIAEAKNFFQGARPLPAGERLFLKVHAEYTGSTKNLLENAYYYHSENREKLRISALQVASTQILGWLMLFPSLHGLR